MLKAMENDGSASHGSSLGPDPVPVRCVISGPILETHLHTP